MYSVQDTLAGGFPHSEIFGSKLVRNSPKLIAAYHVLHRLSAPRHPPDTLSTLDRSHYQYPPHVHRTKKILAKQTSPSAERLKLLYRNPYSRTKIFIKTSLLQTYPGMPRSAAFTIWDAYCSIFLLHEIHTRRTS